jgi:hypothetical protein
MSKFLFFIEFENGKSVVTRGLSKTRVKDLFNSYHQLYEMQATPTIQNFGFGPDEDTLSNQILLKNATVLD